MVIQTATTLGFAGGAAGFNEGHKAEFGAAIRKAMRSGPGDLDATVTFTGTYDITDNEGSSRRLQAYDEVLQACRASSDPRSRVCTLSRMLVFVHTC